MNEKEINSLKEHIKTTSNNIFATFKVEKISNLIIYYEELQNQNTELKEENEKYKGVIDKLKECIEKNKKNIDDSGTYVETYTGWKLIPEILEELLDILKEVESND